MQKYSEVERQKQEFLFKITDIPEVKYKWPTDKEINNWCKNNIKKDFRDNEWRAYSFTDMWFNFSNNYQWIVVGYKHWTYICYINFWYDKNEKHFIF